MNRLTMSMIPLENHMHLQSIVSKYNKRRAKRTEHNRQRLFEGGALRSKWTGIIEPEIRIFDIEPHLYAKNKGAQASKGPIVDQRVWTVGVIE